MNSTLYHFIWDGKPDKVKRLTLCSDYSVGGLKMINVNNFEKGIKISWIKRLLTNQTSQWYELIKGICPNIDNILIFGDGWCKTILNSITNPFWINVLEYWNKFCEIQRSQKTDEILTTCIWYNSDIFKSPTLFPDWYKKGIYLIGDISDSSGEILNFDQLNLKYNGNFNILNFYTVRQGIKNFASKQTEITPSMTYEKPAYPGHLKILIKSKDGTKMFYSLFNSVMMEKPLCENIWQPLLLTQYCEAELADKFKLLYKICFKTIEDNELIWFQYRILYKILGTNDYLKKTNISQTDECNLCWQDIQNIKHLFSECTKVKCLWQNLRNWIANKIGVNITLDSVTKILGYLQFDQYFWPLNFILIITRKYIFWCCRNNFPFDIYFLQKEVKRKYSEQETLYKIKGCGNIFSKRWSLWKNIFNDIESF